MSEDTVPSLLIVLGNQRAKTIQALVNPSELHVIPFESMEHLPGRFRSVIVDMPDVDLIGGFNQDKLHAWLNANITKRVEDPEKQIVFLGTGGKNG
jgi:hypothetical protein